MIPGGNGVDVHSIPAGSQPGWLWVARQGPYVLRLYTHNPDLHPVVEFIERRGEIVGLRFIDPRDRRMLADTMNVSWP